MKAPLQVIVTRPSPYGDELCLQLESNDFTAVHSPLIDFKADDSYSDQQRIELLTGCDTWIFVSRQAVNFCFNSLKPEQLETLQTASQSKRLIAVGPATAQALQSFGFKAMIPATPDSEGMIQLIQQQRLEQQPTCLIRGNQGRQLLQQFFTDETLHILPVYRRVETDLRLPSLTEQSAVVVTSGQLLELADKQLKAQPSSILPTIIAGSERICNKARQLGYTNCYTANSAANSELIKTCILWRNDVT
ncbi:uroporphyrinogen-III synthase [Kangiella shandongensis]|uniref:uroporphyrinogen-III synthase n=1 Tax=Kangiella shandongensis TaxID=2763258 RepID=UPI001CC02F11|nr:uroporphyrinogen-III synthase [Kangiella shandongensis]